MHDVTDRPDGHDAIPESTGLSFSVGTILAIVLGAANVYLGLKAGMTVSASIPAAVISMAIMRGIFRRGTILENNISQSIASTGESLAAGAIFTLPALILAGVWTSFNFWISTGILITGGLLGIVFMVPLRKALIVDRPDLRYPEGVACAEVLQAGQGTGAGVRGILIGLGLGALFKFLATGLAVVRGTVEFATLAGHRAFYFGADLSPALLAVGYIVGLGIAAQVFLGGVIAWVIAIPIVGPSIETTSTDALGIVTEIARGHIRYLGVGAMLVGGLHSIWKVRAGLVAGIASLYHLSAGRDDGAVPRTERNMSFRALATLFVLGTVGTAVLYAFLTGSLWLALVATAVMVPAGFLFAAVATYIVGLVGSSNSPVSGMTICAVLLAVVIIWLTGGSGTSAILATLGVAGVVCCIACSAGDVAQDLKTGQIVGSTPERQQWAEVIGVLIPSFCLTPVLVLLHKAYGIGEGLIAPQATLFASLAKGFFGGGTLPYGMIYAGLAIGLAIIVLDWLLERGGAKFRLHVMPIAVGMYLPLAISVPIMVGGLVHYLVSRVRSDSDESTSGGILLASGLIAGEALMGIGLAIPKVLDIKTELPLPGISGGVLDLASLVLFGALVGYLWRYAARRSAS